MADKDKPTEEDAPTPAAEGETSAGSEGGETRESAGGAKESRTRSTTGPGTGGGRKTTGSAAARGSRARSGGAKSGTRSGGAAKGTRSGPRKAGTAAKSAPAGARRRSGRNASGSAPRSGASSGTKQSARANPATEPGGATAETSGTPKPDRETAAAGGSQRERVAADRFWRFLGIVGFAAISGIVLWLAWAVALLQFVVLLVRGHRNDELAGFMDLLTAYLGQILDYLAGRGETDEMPFPFAAFPDRPDRGSSGGRSG